jgi:hypothetical protein
MKDFQIHRNDIQIFRKEIQAGRNEIQIRRNEIQIHCLYFSKAYAKTGESEPPRPRLTTALAREIRRGAPSGGPRPSKGIVEKLLRQPILVWSESRASEQALGWNRLASVGEVPFVWAGAHVGTPTVDCRKRQTATITPANPGGLPLTLVPGLLLNSQAGDIDLLCRRGALAPRN